MFLPPLELRRLLLPLLIVAFVTSAQSQTGSSFQVVRSFYRFHLSHNHNFDRRNVLHRRPWLTPTLFQLLMNEFRRDAQYAKAHPNETYVPYMEGDPFTNSSEFPSSFRLGRSSVSGNYARVKIILLWNARTSRGTDQRNLEIQLLKMRGSWRINDIVDADHNDDLVTVLKREKYLP